jgi:hypothetical protein
MLRRVTLSNSPDCENKAFKVFQSNLNDRFLFDSLQIVENQIFPRAAFGVLIPLSDSLGVSDMLVWAGKGNYFIALYDQLAGITDEFDNTKATKSITISLTDSLNLQD